LKPVFSKADKHLAKGLLFWFFFGGAKKNEENIALGITPNLIFDDYVVMNASHLQWKSFFLVLDKIPICTRIIRARAEWHNRCGNSKEKD